MILDIRDYNLSISLNIVNQLIKQIHQANTLDVPNSHAKMRFQIDKIFCTYEQARNIFISGGRMWNTYNGIEICIKEETVDSETTLE